MNKKLKLLITLGTTLIMGSTLLAGCSTSSADNGKVQLEVFSTKPENKNILQSMINDFNKQNPNINVTLSAPADAATVLKTRLTKNDVPDVMSLGGDASNYGQLVDADMLSDLTNESFTKQVDKAYIHMLSELKEKQDNKVYAIPYATNASGVIYNKDLFAKLELKVPKTWDELMAVCKQIKASGGTPFYLTLKDSWTGMNLWNTLTSNLEPTNFEKNRKENKTTFAATHGEITDKMLQIGNNAEKDILGVSYDDGNSDFSQGKAFMYVQGNWAISEIKKGNPNIKLGMFPLPARNDPSKNNVTSGVDVAFAISKQSNHQTEAKKFIEYMLEKQNVDRYIKNQFAFSAVKGVEQQDKSVTEIQKSLTDGKIVGFPDHYYPLAFDGASLVQGLYSKKSKIEFLKKLDIEYDKANNR
ncbi:ABC transporter substrate-binding protein [Clostridium arbusti]|uniref:ABC transporter substrate-binding protein n=1 Tax=Clostridium arbusti TaxID=1137848 RepID=UPI000288D59D|nr:extracellular solute-binding protein [Clostridium arbusti]